ncbi:caspase-10-like isoform X1 [Ochotona curzoniae]|uniref:caspase-10-like isoform X1 n=1 Tax=Ochotona curzoniae TaxID=130825 RepID=UPI001B3526B2|nr:caspase-10-like isoform X1 [Ochotona curzoniae]
MASGDRSLSFILDQKNLRELLLELDSQLGAQEVESLKFLCLDLVSKKKLEEADSALDIFELLLDYELVQEQNIFFLAELLYIIKQIKLLQHLGYSKEEVEHMLPTRRKVPLFRKMLYDLSEGISAETLNSMKFLLGGSLPKSEMNSLKFLDYLEKQGKIRENDLTFLEELCKKVTPSLTRIIEKYIEEKAAVDKETEPLQQEEEEIISQADIEQFNGALPVGTVMGWSVFNHLFYLLLPTSKKEKKDEARAKERRNCA